MGDGLAPRRIDGRITPVCAVAPAVRSAFIICWRLVLVIAGCAVSWPILPEEMSSSEIRWVRPTYLWMFCMPLGAEGPIFLRVALR